jgi:tRNA G26 N,N-dimethylase Trm1
VQTATDTVQTMTLEDGAYTITPCDVRISVVQGLAGIVSALSAANIRAMGVEVPIDCEAYFNTDSNDDAIAWVKTNTADSNGANIRINRRDIGKRS